MGEQGGFWPPWGQGNWCSEQNTVFTEQWDRSPFWPGKGNQPKRGIDSSWIFIHDQIDSTMLTSTCRLCSAGAWVALAHPKGGQANAEAFIFNINLEQLQFCSMPLIIICPNIWRQFFMFVLPLLPQLLLFLTSIPQLVFPCQACLWKMS